MQLFTLPIAAKPAKLALQGYRALGPAKSKAFNGSICQVQFRQVAPAPALAVAALSMLPLDSNRRAFSVISPACTTSRPCQGQRSYSAQGVAAGHEPVVHQLYDRPTGAWQYVVADPSTRNAVIIDPVLDFDAATGTIATVNAEKLLSIIKESDYHVEAILETHAHADHLTAASYLQGRLSETQGIERPLISIGKCIKQVQQMFAEKYDISATEVDGVFDKLFDDGEEFNIGNLKASAQHIPGHTPDHMGYKIGDNVFVGDSILPTDLGSARADFPGGSAETLFASARKLFALPDHVRIWVGHDYPQPGRDEPVASVTLGEQKQFNKHLNSSVQEPEFLKMRKDRDQTLAAPKLIDASLQFNIRAGRLPPPTQSGSRLLHMPLKLKGVTPW